jgi:hypothetical protein
LTRCWLTSLAFAGNVGGSALAQTIPNAACTVGEQSSLIRDGQGSNLVGSDMVAVIRARNGGTSYGYYMAAPFSMDDGKGQGGLAFYDISNWKAPVRKQRYEVDNIREAHGLGFTEMFGDSWRTAIVMGTKGFLVYDWDDIANPVLKKEYLIQGSSKGGIGSAASCSGSCVGSYDAYDFGNGKTYNYDNGVVWHLKLAAPYLYVANAENGLNVYRFSAPAIPRRSAGSNATT